jgi:hypothetical protein
MSTSCHILTELIVEVQAHLAKCRRRRWVETRPAINRGGKGPARGRVQAWRLCDPRSRIFADGGDR